VTNDFRSRILAPILIPVLIVVVMGAFVGSVAALLLFNTKTGALAFAAVAAGGILFAISLAAGRERLDTRGRMVLSVAATLPFILGLGVATGVLGDVLDEDRMINVLPLISIPEDAPVIAAENSLEFCLIDDVGECVPTRTWQVVPSAVTQTLSFVFQNLEPQIPHNVVITQLEGTLAEPLQGETIVESTLISGIASEYFVAEDISWDDLPENWYFFCRVHANMNGTGTVVRTDGMGGAEG
jgi:hypothetical protein